MVDAPASGIFISYGREDGYAEAHAIAKHLRDEIGHSQVFLDVDDLRAGQAWANEISHRLKLSRVLVVLIGPEWLQARLIQARDRVDDGADPTRREIDLALDLGLRIIPVLLNGASFPRLEGLPPYLRHLARRQALTLDSRNLDEGIGPLVYSIRQVLTESTVSSDSEVVNRNRSDQSGNSTIKEFWGIALTTTLTHTRRRVAQILHPLGGEVLPAITVWRVAYWLLLAALLLWGVVWPYLWPALMPTPAAVAAAEEPLPAATGPVLPEGTRFRDCRDATCPWLRVLPAGTFTMGSPDDEPGRDKDEGPQHQVTVTKPFAVMETEVTVGLFKAFVAEARYEGEPGCWIWDGKESKDDPKTNWRKPFAAANQADDHPVVCVSWNTARAFARWMTKRTGQPYRLLSEAEWEYAARAGSQAAYSFGADAKQLCSFANVGDLRTRQGYPQWGKDWVYADCDDGYVYTAPVGSFRPNAFGLYDMHGNAWEWVQDCQNDYTAAARTAEAVESTNCANRLLRGGGWNFSPWSARSAYRNRIVPSDRSDYTGFRLARMLP